MKPVVLVVDDEELLRMLATDYFQDDGFEVLQAVDGSSALTILKNRPDISAVVTDVQMPGTPDGLALSHHVREANPRAAIVVVSGRLHPSVEEIASGARFVAKPYSVSEIVRLVRRMIKDVAR